VFSLILGNWRENADMSSVKEDLILLAENERFLNFMVNIIKLNAASKDPDKS